MQALTTFIKVKDANGRVIEEKEVATYAGVLAKAHEEGLSSIETKLLQVPGPDNGYVAIVEAKATTSRGTFSGIGDAHEGNVPRKIAPHLIRMAETRAKARCLKDAVNIGTVSLEELGSLQDDAVDATPAPAPQPVRRDNVRPLPVRPPPSPRSPPPGPEARQSAGREQPPGREVFPRGNTREPERPPARPQPMTENQRRLLYRMLAEQGFEGEAATDALLRAAEVNDLREITKDDASALIDAWKREQEAARA
ncbi:MAG: hypothetical protein ACOZNI_25170 [Myxococcota bacterium]